MRTPTPACPLQPFRTPCRPWQQTQRTAASHTAGAGSRRRRRASRHRRHGPGARRHRPQPPRTPRAVTRKARKRGPSARPPEPSCHLLCRFRVAQYTPPSHLHTTPVQLPHLPSPHTPPLLSPPPPHTTTTGQGAHESPVWSACLPNNNKSLLYTHGYTHI